MELIISPNQYDYIIQQLESLESYHGIEIEYRIQWVDGILFNIVKEKIKSSGMHWSEENSIVKINSESGIRVIEVVGNPPIIQRKERLSKIDMRIGAYILRLAFSSEIDETTIPKTYDIVRNRNR